MRAIGKVCFNLRRERCTYGIITAFFGLSYFGRAFMNEKEICGDVFDNYFLREIVEAVVYLIEALSMGVLMYFHLINFKSGKLL